MTKKAEESNKVEEGAPSGDVTENEEEEVQPQAKPQAKPKPAAALPVVEQVENHETIPAWFKPFGDQLSSITEALKPKPQPEPKQPEPEKPESEVQDGKAQGKKKQPKIKFWRTL